MTVRIDTSPQHHHEDSPPPSPSMSQSQQQGGQSRQPVSYPSPTSYPSPGMSSAQYSYPAPNNQQVNEPYRASPTGSNGSLSLPSMRSLDPLQQQAHQQHMGSPLPPPVAPMGGPYYHSNQTLPHPQLNQYPNVTSDPTNANMRYALPQPDQRVMSGGRHKKEIKRRTKTGCLTCRKRRIKCDEQHPACRNCQKSKRECLGYDPIFKQQPGPAAIQPAPSSAPSQASTAAPSNPYGNQPSMYGAQVPNMGYEQALSAGVSSPGSASQQFDYSSAIDPALEAASAPTASNANQFQQSPSGMPNFREDLKRELHSASPYSSGASDSPHIRGGATNSFSPSSSHEEHYSTAYASSAKRINMDDLLELGGPLPPPLPANSTNPLNDPVMLDEIKHLYHSIYSPGLESFLETKWFAVKGVARLMGSNQLLEQFNILLNQFGTTPGDNIDRLAYVTSVEARVVWALASMVRSAGRESLHVKMEGGIPVSDDAVEAGHRLTVFENLLTGVVADHNPLTPASPGAGDHHRLRELEFWYHLAEFTTVAGTAAGVDNTLAALRNLLDGRENRDVLYSIAIVRSLSPRVAGYSEHDRPLHLDESDPRSKLAVAKQLVKHEADGAGTTNVIRRLCELAVRSWSAPSAPPASSK